MAHQSFSPVLEEARDTLIRAFSGGRSTLPQISRSEARSAPPGGLVPVYYITRYLIDRVVDDYLSGAFPAEFGWYRDTFRGSDDWYCLVKIVEQYKPYLTDRQLVEILEGVALRLEQHYLILRIKERLLA